MGKATKKEIYDEKARRKKKIKKERKIEKTNKTTLLQSVPTRASRRSTKEQAWKKFGKDRLTCKDGVINLLQFLDEKLSIRAAEPEEQTAEAFNGRKFEKRRKTGMGRRKLPFSLKLQVVMSTLPSYPIKTGVKGEPNMMTANVTSCLCLYDSDRYITTVNNERDWKGKQYFDQFAYEKFWQAGMVEAQAK